MRYLPPLPSRHSRLTPLPLCLSLIMVLFGCGGGEDAGTAGTPRGQANAQTKTQGGRPGGGPGGRPQMPAVPVAVEAAGLAPIASYYTATATLEPNKEAEVLSRVSGVILSLNAEEGDRVTEGQSLLQIDDSEYQLRAKQAMAEHEKQLTRFDRIQKMSAGDLISAEEYDTAKNDLQSAEAARDLAQLDLSYAGVQAPFTGHIIHRYVDPGETVNEGTPLFAIADLGRLLARVHVPAKEFRRIQPDQPVEVELDSNGEVFQGRITLVSPVIDPSSGTIKVTVEMSSHPASARPGDFTEVSIVTDRHAEALVVPRLAVISDRSEQVVFVVADSTAERRVVETGFEDDQHVEILAGIIAGDQVVVQGQRSLKDGAAIKIMDRIVFEDESEETQEPGDS